MLLSLDRKYKAHHIRPDADQNPDTKNWTPRVLISWEENGKSQYATLYGLRDQCENLPEALTDSVELAMDWIDQGKPHLNGRAQK